MPTYEYECTACKEIMEKFQSMTAKPLKKCPSCGGALRRLIGGGAGFIFKGSGFYATDYRSDAYTKKAKEEKGGTKEACKSCPQGATCGAKT
jgi:putative FmdB family regulatory protein